ncbi:regulatory protein RecX [Alteromonas sp. ASW11-130]|uniref:regulatory protein RecX n=1 Tax=Alteromonas sp. ASW11-130 TaxID=3015775 RepID=UPI0022423F17|nr:regulatory protein RecX [Alteromonas sp. ASW11-130]MCW8092861.1 recombination regulator RecX [Alteromonas sp. ASW11-130]
MTNEIRKKLIESTTRLLARREHSVTELVQKLASKGFELDSIYSVVEEFKQADIQSDRRFAESRVRHAANKGIGPNRVKTELSQHKIDETLVFEAFKEAEIDWFELAKTVHAKKYKGDISDSFKEQQKQRQFLQYRGFTFEQIQYAIENA